MQVVIDVKEGYAAQFLSILQSLDGRFFNQVKIEKDSQFMHDKAYLETELEELKSGHATMVSLFAGDLREVFFYLKPIIYIF